MTPFFRLCAGILLVIAGCSTQPPAPLGIDHPAHPGALTSPTTDSAADALLTRYRDFSPRARGTKPEAPPSAGQPENGGGHDHPR